MTKEEIQGNILISTLFGEPMPFHDSRKGKITLYFKYGHTTAHCQDYELEYSSDWNWLMAAVDKVTEVSKPGAIHNYWNGDEVSDIRIFRESKEKTFNEIVKFMEWYNLFKSN